MARTASNRSVRHALNSIGQENDAMLSQLPARGTAGLFKTYVFEPSDTAEKRQRSEDYQQRDSQTRSHGEVVDVAAARRAAGQPR